jgi:integrase
MQSLPAFTAVDASKSDLPIAPMRADNPNVEHECMNNILTVLGHVLQVGRKRGLLATVPEISRVKTPLPDWDFLTFEEAERLVAHADGVWRTMILVALRTGLRRGELLALRWEDVDLDRGRIRVVENYVRGHFKAPKNGKPREVPLSGEARAALAQHRHMRGERVFCDAKGKPFTQGSWRASSNACARAATVAHRVPSGQGGAGAPTPRSIDCPRSQPAAW